MQPSHTPDAWLLVQAQLDDGDALAPAASAFCAAVGARLHRTAWSPAQRTAYAYLRLPQVPEDTTPLAAQFAANCPGAADVRASRLELVFDATGASAGAPPAFHYVVEMDPEDGWMPEIARWYDTEHMPGLAAVPGCVRAMRFLNHGHGPLSLACYDLVSEETLGSPPWLAVRATAWSDIARPHFTNTRRTMFRIPGTGL